MLIYKSIRYAISLMIKPFREYHLDNFLTYWENQGGPLDAALATYFRSHKALGSKDRGEISEKVYSHVRWQLLPEGKDDPSLPLHLRASAPLPLWEAFVRSYGEEKAFHLLLESNYPAPTTIRINPLKTTREALFEKWKNSYDISLTEHSPLGITFHKKIVFFSLSEFKEGLFEIQDEASQLVASEIDPKPGDHILDWCAGSGGKTLGFAFKTQGKGQIYLHDVRKGILYEAKKRVARAGIQNIQLLFADEEKKQEKLKRKMDWVLVDAPCTGTGTLRRNPDMKYRFDEKLLSHYVGEQRKIFEKALSFLKPGGKIVYATCSILKDENEQQLDHFLKTYPLKCVKDPFRSLPSRGGMDGMFAATLTTTLPAIPPVVD